MGEYANVKSKKFFQLLKWLSNHKRFEVVHGGRHVAKAHAIETNSSYPLPLSHKEVNKNIVKDFRDWLVRNNVCTTEEFDEHIG